MAWTLTGVVARLGSALGVRRSLGAARAARASAFAEGAPDRPDVYARVAERRIAASSPADAASLAAALAEAGPDAPIVERAIASGAPVAAIAELAVLWERVPDPVRDAIRHPLGTAGHGPVTWPDGARVVPATQIDATTCGAASLAMLELLADPFVALWLLTGWMAAGHCPAAVPPGVVDPRLPVAERWAILQRRAHARLVRGALGPLAWPARWGSPPWRMAAEARCAGARYDGAWVNDASADEVASLAAQVRAAVLDGLPVPLYVGGDSARGLAAAVPRHVVLAVAGDGEGVAIYEPSSGALYRHVMTTASARRDPAYGNWNRIVWAVLPKASQR